MTTPETDDEDRPKTPNRRRENKGKEGVANEPTPPRGGAQESAVAERPPRAWRIPTDPPRV